MNEKKVMFGCFLRITTPERAGLVRKAAETRFFFYLKRLFFATERAPKVDPPPARLSVSFIAPFPLPQLKGTLSSLQKSLLQGGHPTLKSQGMPKLFSVMIFARNEKPVVLAQAHDFSGPYTYVHLCQPIGGIIRHRCFARLSRTCLLFFLPFNWLSGAILRCRRKMV
jgi:hypothetical protein